MPDYRSAAGILLCCGALLSPPASIAATPDANQTAAELQATVERLNALTEWFNEAEQKRTIWLVELQRSDRDIAKLNKAVAEVRDALQATERELSQLQGKQQNLQFQRQRQARLIATHIAAAYRLSGQDFLKQLLNQESPDTFARMVRYHRYFSESRLDTLDQYQTTLAQLAETNQALSDQQERQSAQRAELEGQQHALASDRAGRASLIAELDAEKESKSAEYERLLKDRSRLEQLLAELRRRATDLDGTAFAKAKGQLPMPVAGRIRHAFGSRRADGRLRWHGIDIDAPHGTDVKAVFRGRVLFADWLRGFGFLTIVDHGNEYMTLYGHADVLHKRVGDLVEAGELIAGAGNSGGNAEAGLYFEVRHQGKPLDPITWVRR